MKVTKENPEPSFKPIKISILIESREEFNSIVRFAAETNKIPYVRTDYNEGIIKDFIQSVYDALRE